MKSYLYAMALFIALSLAACHKDKGQTPLTIVGTWSIVTDSTDARNVGSGNGSGGTKYIGVPADHFIFTTNKLYIKENNLLDTANYTVVKDTLKLTYFYQGKTVSGNDYYIITMPDADNLTLSSTAITPGGIFDEYITLKR